MKEHKLNTLRFAIISVVSIISLVIGLIVYYDNLVDNLQDATCGTLNEVMQQEKNSFAKSLEEDSEALKGYAELAVMSDYDSKSLPQFLDAIVNSTSFEYVFFVQPDGNSLGNSGERNYVGDRDYFLAAMRGETVISEPIKSKIRDVNVIAVATPVLKSGKIVGALTGSFKAEKLNELFMASFDGYGYTYVATNTGELIAKTASEYTSATKGNLFDLYGAADFYKNDSYETMRQNLVEGKGGHSQYRVNGQPRLLHYDKLAINGWNIFSVVNPVGVTDTANRILRNAALLASGLLAVFIALLFYNLLNQKRFTRELTHAAYVDDVTGYRSFAKFKLDAAALLRGYLDDSFMLVKMDIENFKLINEIYSMETGDQVLKNVAEAMAMTLDDEQEAFGRIHADEFIALIRYRTDEEWQEKKRRFETLFAQSCENTVSFKIILPQGRYKLEKDETNFNQIYEKANFAHRLAKHSDSKDLQFDGKVKERAIREREIENKMEGALQAEEFQMYLQPKYRLNDEKIVGAEALVRWVVGGEPVVYPGEFIPLFEQNGFIIKLDLYMFERACRTLRSWIDGGIEPVTISVNFSRLHLNNEQFVEELTALAQKYQVPCHLLEVELTETAMLDNLDTLEAVLNRLHSAGFTLSMDDFGTGYSSLGLLKNIPVDVIKIDKAFFDHSRDLQRAKTVISSVLDMAHKLDIRTVAEGVETQAHIDLLRELRCETVQGYYYAKPMSVEQLEITLLRSSFAQT